MRRFERYAQELLATVDHADLAPLLDTLSEEELVRLLGGMAAATDADRLARNIVTTALENRILRIKALLHESVLPPAERDLGVFTSALARALRVEGACIDEVAGDDRFRLHAHFGLPEPIMLTESCTRSSMALCQHVLETGTTLNVADLSQDPRWCNAPAFANHGLLHYAGAPGFAPDGTLRCVLWVADHRPRTLSVDEVTLLERLARRLATEFDAPSVARRALNA